MTDASPSFDLHDITTLIVSFTDNLTVFATGGYLREEEREFWQEPFDPVVIPQLRALLVHHSEAAVKLSRRLGIPPTDLSTAELEFTQSIFQLYDELDQLNERCFGAVIEPEEEAEIEEILHQLWARCGIIPTVASAIPSFEEFHEIAATSNS